MALGLEPDHTLQVPPLAHPEIGGWYTGAPIPGDPGTAVLAGHVDGDHQRGIFWALSKVKTGDLIYVSRSDGETAEFRVVETNKYCKESTGCSKGERVFPTRTFYSSQPTPELHLATCGGRYDSKDHNYLESIVVISRLVNMH